ncbi:hypothetical protein CR513_44789, partial [Mucuna pruriens]
MSKTAKGKAVQSIIKDLDTDENPIKTIPLPFPSSVVQARKFEINDELLQNSTRQIPKYAKFLKELCINKRKKLKGDMEVGRNVSALIKSEQFSTLIQPVMPKKCSDPSTFLFHALSASAILMLCWI